MAFIVLFYLMVTGMVFVSHYEQTQDECKIIVRKHWIRYFGMCLAWPLILLRKNNGFTTGDR